MKTLSFWIFIFTLIFSPLAFGSAEPWSMAIMQMLVPLGLCCYLASQYGRKTWYTVPGLWPLLCLLLFICLQVIPLPPGLLQVLSPHSLAIYKPIMDLPGGPNFVPISINTKATIGEFFRLATYVLFYILTIQLTASYPRLRKTLFIVIGLAAGIAFFAVIQKFTSPDKIYWFREVPGKASATGPWVYRNHFAGFMEMLIPFGLALFLHYRPHIRYEISLREKIISVLTLPTANRHIIFGFATFVMSISILVSLSRGGIISSILAILCFFLILYRGKQLQAGKLPLLVGLSMVILLASWIGWEPVITRFNSMTNAQNEFFDGRFHIWSDTLPILRDFWFTGSGFGTFIYIFPFYRNAMPAGSIVDHAHNDYLELIATGGVIGTLLVLWFLGSVLYQAILHLRKRRDSNAKLLGSAAICGLLAFFFHSVTDFNFYNGANGLYVFFLCALLISTTHTRKHSKQRTYLKKTNSPGYLLAIPVLGAGIALFLVNQGKAQAYQTYSSLKNIYLNRLMPESTLQQLAGEMEQAYDEDPLSGTYPYSLAGIYTFLPNSEAVSRYYIAALYRQPTKPSYLMQAGLHFGVENKDDEFNLLKAAARANKTSSWVNRNLASWYLKLGDRKRGVEYLKTALLLEKKPDQFNQYIAIALTGGISLLEFEDILPKTTRSYIQMASFLARENDAESAAFYYKEGMKYLDQEEMKAWYFNSAFWFFWKQKDFASCMDIARTAVDSMPEEVSILLMAGDIYRKQELTYKAGEYYQQVLLLEPGNKRAARGIERMQRQF